MALLDVNTLVALAWDSHVHHHAARAWFAARSADGWATCPVTESGFVRVSSNPKVLPSFIAVEAARGVLSLLRDVGGHRFLANDVSLTDVDVPPIAGLRRGSRRGVASRLSGERIARRTARGGPSTEPKVRGSNPPGLQSRARCGLRRPRQRTLDGAKTDFADRCGRRLRCA